MRVAWSQNKARIENASMSEDGRGGGANGNRGGYSRVSREQTVAGP